MAKYKNLSPQLREGIIGKLFGALATRAAKKHIKNISKKDPKLGGLLARICSALLAALWTPFGGLKLI